MFPWRRSRRRVRKGSSEAERGIVEPSKRDRLDPKGSGTRSAKSEALRMDSEELQGTDHVSVVETSPGSPPRQLTFHRETCIEHVFDPCRAEGRCAYEETPGAHVRTTSPHPIPGTHASRIVRCCYASSSCDEDIRAEDRAWDIFFPGPLIPSGTKDRLGPVSVEG